MMPRTIEEAQALLAENRGRVVFTGGGTEMRELPPHDLELCTRALNRIVEYAPSDQVFTAEAGVTLAALQTELSKQGQRLALEAPHADEATLGGIVAANSFGPLRTRYGSVRDLIIGVSILRADGTRAKGGGKVVKTVAGFDLPKLMCGSRGTLGMIATVTFRVHPLPEHSLSLVARAQPAAAVVELVRRVRALQLEPAAMLATRTPQGWDVALRFEGFRAGVLQQRERLSDLDEAPAQIWDQHLRERGPIRFGALPTQLPQLDLPQGACWYPTLGLGFARMIESAPLLAAGGWCDRSPSPASLALHRAVKQRMDPQGVLAPGSFVGGI